MKNKLKAIIPPGKKLAAILSISFASAFTLFIYTPMDMYLHNPSEFMVSWKFMLLPLLGAFLVSFLAISVVLTVIYYRKTIVGVILFALLAGAIIVARFVFTLFSVAFVYMIAAVVIAMIIWVLLIKLLKEDALTVVILGMWGIIFAAYVQTLFLNGRMAAIMGQQTDYSGLSTGNIVNLLIWVIIIFAPICIWLQFKIKKKEFRYEKAFVLSLVIISGMQIVGLVSTAVTTNIPEGYDEKPVYFSYENTVNLSSDNNVIVFVLDSLDVRVVRYIFELYPHLREYFDGFTLYENHTAEHFDTIPSMVSLLTQHHVPRGMDGPVYREEAWARHNFIDTLRENGVSTNLYLDISSTFERYELISTRADNMISADGLIVNLRPIITETTRLSLGRLSPYLLKNTWLAPIAPSFSSAFFTVHADNPVSIYIPIVGIEADMWFHRFLMQSEFSANNEQTVFMLMHLNSVHADGDINDPSSYGYHFDEASGEIRHGGSRWDVGRASFEKLNLYFNGMREIGVLDNSTIIITGDHGRRSEIPETVSLFIKPPNSAGTLVTDTTTELSIKYLPATILDAAGLPHEAYGISYFDIINGLIPAPPVRYLHVVGGWTNSTARIRGDYGIWEVVGDANNIDNWTFIPSD